ncbi:hypothetical protein LG651_12070 [Tamlana sp. 62-3]|uniref:Uncharacterized protein n=1 Tax=Neotamlana sargassicola TaxID=2883125 RepID=A0A9X1L5A9_9FLAO|nr:hypothetical protein [Tamlana sargassicola]MCB4808985.1 hypothetical protein [Tamlana sargassicola]
MKDFLLEHYLTISLSVEFLSAIIGLLFYKKYKSTVAKYFLWFLVYLSVCDFISTYVYYVRNDGFFSFLEGTVLVSNYWWSTIFWKIGAIIFFAFYFYKIIKSKQLKAIIKYSGIIFFLFSVVYVLTHWGDFFKRYFPIIDVIGAFIIFLCTIFYFFEVLQSDRILTFNKSLNFYISSAIFIWWLIVTPIVFYDIYNSNRDWDFIFLKWEIYLFANLCMYLTFSFAIIYCKPDIID